MDDSTNEPKSKRKLGCLGRALRAAILTYVVILGLIMFFEEYLIFPAPTYPSGNWNPPLQFEDVTFSSDDGTQLNGWYFAHDEPKGFLLYSHGNGDFLPYLGDHADYLRDRYQYSVFIYDYRGYGKSQGKPKEAGVLADGAAAQRWLADRAEIRPDQVVLMGRSLGGGVSVDLAATQGARGLILESTFSSMPDVAARLYPWIPVRFLMRTRMNSVKKISAYNGPVLQSHGDADTLIPLELANKLHEAIPGAKEFVVVPKGQHNSPQPEAYYLALEKFLADLPPQTAR